MSGKPKNLIAMSLALLVGAAAVASGTQVVRSGEFHPWYYRLLGIGKPEYPISGFVEQGFAEVEKVFSCHFEAGKEVGASVAVFGNGKKVVELYGGYSDYEKRVLYSSETLQLVCSSAKVLESIALARLVEAGKLSYEATVASIWPEFEFGEKGRVTISDLMRHEAGLAYIDGPKPPLEDLMHLDKLASLLANQEHLHGGKKVRCYHGLNRGWVLNEVIRRVTGKTLGQIYNEEFNGLPGVEVHLGLSGGTKARRSRWYNYPSLDASLAATLPVGLSNRILSDVPLAALKPDEPFPKVRSNLSDDADFSNHASLAEFEIPSINVFTNASSLARMGAYLANGGSLDGRQLLSPSSLQEACGGEIEDFDSGLHIDTIMTKAGFGVYIFPEFDTKFYGWAGLGGSAFVFNIEHNFSFAYVMNAAHSTLTLSGRSRELLIAAFKAHLQTATL